MVSFFILIGCKIIEYVGGGESNSQKIGIYPIKSSDFHANGHLILPSAPISFPPQRIIFPYL